MTDCFVDSTTMEGQGRIRAYALAWLERLDYADRLEREWDADELGTMLWARIDHEFAPLWDGPVTCNRALAEIICAAMVEDYFAAYPEPRASRYSVRDDFGDSVFRRCATDFIDDLDEYEPALLPTDPAAAADLFWADVRVRPERWGYDPKRGPFVDDEAFARQVALEAITEYYALRDEVELLRASQSEARPADR